MTWVKALENSLATKQILVFFVRMIAIAGEMLLTA